MKKFYSLMLAMLLAAVGFSAQAYQITVVTNEAEHLKVYLGEEQLFLNVGDNQIEVTGDTMLKFASDFGWNIWSVTRTKDGQEPVGEYIDYGMCNIQLDESLAGYTWTVDCSDFESRRTASCTVNVDNAELVSLRSMLTYDEYELTNGDNTIKFIPDLEGLEISCTNWESRLYKVTMDGAEVPLDWDVYNVMPTEGCLIKIEANFPDIDCQITFDFVNEGTEGAIAAVTVDHQVVEDWQNGFTVKAGKSIDLELNNAEYAVTVTANGEEFQSSIFVTEDVAFVVDATKFSTIPFTLNLDNPAAVTVYRGDVWEDIVYANLKAGENQLEVSTGNPQITLKAKAGCEITSVTLDGEAVEMLYDSYYVNITENCVVAVETYSIPMDKTLVVYVNNAENLSNYDYDLWGYFFGMGSESVDATDELLVTGYQTFNFTSDGKTTDGEPYVNDCFWFYNYGAQPGMLAVYLNNQELEWPDPWGEGPEPNWQSYPVQDKDVLKIYSMEMPQTLQVTFQLEECTADQVKVTADLVSPVDVNATYSCLSGTRLQLEAAEGLQLEATVNGDELCGTTDGKLSCDIDADATITLKATASGIANVAADKLSGNGNVYNLQGIRVATDGNTANLPAGIYLHNGHKVIVK